MSFTSFLFVTRLRPLKEIKKTLTSMNDTRGKSKGILTQGIQTENTKKINYSNFGR